MKGATREILVVLAVATAGVAIAGAIVLIPWHPHLPATSAVVEVYAPHR
ncbi:MAG: hypothetical protein HOU81_11840 [Hamadaea sp.]|nr:hypothetical protein [Hamadaea sp.]NUR71503.1 hypothetical protein [Hamadaea sp.]NUT22142.1 hypothetical protein [Hamadaea sp.]